MATLGDIVTRIQARLFDANGTAVGISEIVPAVNAAIKYYKQNRFFFNQKSLVIPLVAQNPVLPLPSDFLCEIPQSGITIEFAQVRYPVRKVTPEVYDSVVTFSYGIPDVYTNRAGQIEFFPYPDIAYNARLLYLKDYPDLVNLADSNDFTVNADQMITYNALMRLHGELRQDPTMADYYMNQARTEFNQLSARTSKLNASGFVNPVHLVY